MKSLNLRPALIALGLLLSACQSSGHRTETGTDIGKKECEDQTLAQSRLNLDYLVRLMGNQPEELQYCRFGDRQINKAAWKNGTFVSFGEFYGGFAEVNPYYLLRQLNKKLNLDLSASDLTETRGRHNTLWYYTHVLNQTVCSYAVTFSNDWGEASSNGNLSRGFFFARICIEGAASDQLLVQALKSVGEK